jgi:undecaprenyl-diphosphatase
MENNIIINLQKLNIKNLMLFISFPFNTRNFIILIIILFCFNILEGKHLYIVFIAVLFKTIIKLLVNRERPYIQNKNIKNLSNHNYNSLFSKKSFPSGHTMVATILTFILINKYHYNEILYIIPVLVGISRIYLGVHYPSDVIIGFIIGYVFSFMTLNC